MEGLKTELEFLTDDANSSIISSNSRQLIIAKPQAGARFINTSGAATWIC